MVDEEFEFLLTQYLDGALSPDQAQQVRRRIQEDSSAQQLYAEYKRLDVLMSSAPAMPNIQWDVLGDKISKEVAAQPSPVRSYKMPLAWVGASVALAACALITVGVALGIHGPQPGPDIAAQAPQTASAVATVSGSLSRVIGPQSEAPAGPSGATIQIIPPQSVADGDEFIPYAEGVVHHPSHISIASTALPKSLPQ